MSPSEDGYELVDRVPGISVDVEGSEVSEEQLEKLFSEADINGDGRIDFEEFVKVLKKDS